jgi:hypothetical protein
VAAHEPFATAKATQHQVNQSGVMGKISIVDTPAGPSYTGTATGLEPLAPLFRYTTLVYDTGSVPGGPIACEPTVELPGMFVGTWAVDAEGNGTLIQLAPTEPLASIDTISIRDTTINFGFGPEAVLACGQISVHPAAR